MTATSKKMTLRDCADTSPAEIAWTIEDFYALAPEGRFIYAPTRETWPASSVDSRLPQMQVDSDKPIAASKYLAKFRSVEQMTWWPGQPMIIRDRLVSEGGWIPKQGVNVFNLYRGPMEAAGDPQNIDPWMRHIQAIYPDAVDHIVKWFAHRVQKPGEKLNHALVLGGGPGIGKDTIQEPVKDAVGSWNFGEVSPKAMASRFNGFVKNVIVRMSEARDTGDLDRYALYEHMKVYLAAPPDVLRVDEKNIREYSIPNVMGVVITSNNKTNGLFLPPDDRRHYVAWSDATKEDFPPAYWNRLWGWYASGGRSNVAVYLRTLDLTGFDPKAPPPRTAAWREIVDSNRVPEDASLADALDRLGNPAAVTIAKVADRAEDAFKVWLLDRRNARVIPHRFEEAGYSSVRNDAAKDGYFAINGKRVPVYARRELSAADRLRAAQALVAGDVW